MMLTIILLLIGAMISALALRSLHAGRLKERYVVLFVLVGIPFVALAIWPDAVGTVAAKLEIEYPTVLLLGVTTFFLLVNLKLLSIVSMHEQRIT
ncbi:MAG: DUF2304 domain-containing protein, partial [Phycisphaerales bacterium]|nr:DUF2304 domain-containing protein [Phycisphaerales bacterium]